MYYYAARTDKNGNRLLTSYGNAASQKKYGGPDARLFSGVYTRNLESSEFAELDNPMAYDFEAEEVVRSRIHNPNPSGSHGKFVIKRLDNNEWKETQFRSNSYGTANSIMKALAEIYSDLIVVEETDSVSAGPVGGASYDF